jgi:hypothetical protein
MSIYHPIFDDEKRVWNLLSDISVEEYARIFCCASEYISIHLTKKGLIFRHNVPNAINEYMATELYDGGAVGEPKVEGIPPTFWDSYIAPHIIAPSSFMTPEFDEEDIELAQIIMDEIEEERS